MIIVGAVGSLASMVYFFSVRMKNSEEINTIYSEAVGTTFVGTSSTVNAIRNTKGEHKKENNNEEIKLTDIKDKFNGQEETAFDPEETEMMDVLIKETELMSTGNTETALLEER
jgi:hypothetical protein